MSDELEIKQQLDDIGRTFENGFKEVNDRIDELEKKGQSSDPIDQDHLERINKALDEKTLEVKALQDSLKSNEEKTAQLETAMGRPEFHGGSNQTDMENKAFNEFLRKGQESEILEERKALRDSELPTAGYLATHEMSNSILKKIEETSPMRSLVRVININGIDYKLPKRTGLPGAVWLSEGEDSPRVSGLEFGQDIIVPHERYVEHAITESMLEDDGYDIQGEISEAFGIAFGRQEGIAFIKGTGVKQPEGFATNKYVPTYPIGSAQWDAAKGADTIINMAHSLKSGYFGQSTWIMNLKTIGEVRKLKTSSGEYLMQLNFQIAGSPFGTLQGRPIVEMPDMDNFTDTASADAPTTVIAFGDWSRAYYAVDRLGISVERNPWELKRRREVLFSGRGRLGGQIVMPEAIIRSETTGAFTPQVTRSNNGPQNLGSVSTSDADTPAPKRGRPAKTQTEG